MKYKLHPKREPDQYRLMASFEEGTVLVTGIRSVGEFFFKTGRGRFWYKDNAIGSLSLAPAYTFPAEFVEQCLSELSECLDPVKHTFTVYADPGHGWLGVPVWLLKDLDLEAAISSYSYLSRNGRMSYLEEDCDLPLFAKRFEQTFGQSPRHLELYSDSWFIRDLPSFSTSKISPLITA